MSKIRCIIIEDDPLAVKVLTDYISDTPFLQLQEVFKDAILASDYLRNYDTDLIFLDIHLPKLKGMAFLKTLANTPSVIITTAYHQYALEGFNLNVTDYLLKPFEFSRFLTAVNKVIENRKLQEERREFIFVNVQKRKVKIVLSEILFIESQREYIKIVTAKSEYHSKMGTQEIEDLLPSNLFKRIHRSFIVSINKIDSYTADMIEINGVSIPIGRG
ncbi:MAG TPA: LytTR family DNA-binding domain-containing protein, partial [Puia sp.]|nr:LytTR family DNA-binding domain-containing protein [Puia sp.]